MTKVYSTYPVFARVKFQPTLLRNFYGLCILMSFILIAGLFLPWLRFKAFLFEATLNGIGVLRYPLGEIQITREDTYLLPVLGVGVILLACAGLVFRNNFFFLPLTIIGALEAGFFMWKLNNPVVGYSFLSNIPALSFQPEIGFFVGTCCAVTILLLAISGVIYMWFYS